MPVTHGVTGSSPVRTAKRNDKIVPFFISTLFEKHHPKRRILQQKLGNKQKNRYLRKKRQQRRPIQRRNLHIFQHLNFSIMNKEDLAKFKGKKVTFKKVTAFPDIKIKFVSSFPDYKIKVADSQSFAVSEVITYQEVSAFPDVQLEKTNSFEDFQIWFE